jgi:hypothetical protein
MNNTRIGTYVDMKMSVQDMVLAPFALLIGRFKSFLLSPIAQTVPGDRGSMGEDASDGQQRGCW